MKKEININELQLYAEDFLQDIKDIHPFEHAIFQVMFATGLRFNDVAKFSKWNKKNKRAWQIKTSKNGRTITIANRRLNKLFISLLDNNEQILNYTSYNRCRHIFSSYFAMLNISTNNKLISTHVFRHLKAKILYKKGLLPKYIAKILGEKNENSANWYINSHIFEM